MTPDAPDLPKQSKKGDFHLVEFSLTDKARDKLQAELDQYFAAPEWDIGNGAWRRLDNEARETLQARRLEHLKGIVERHFPEDILTRIRSMAESGEIHPVIIHNLPHDTQAHEVECERETALLSILHTGKRERFYSEAIANGIYAMLEYQPSLNALLRRDLKYYHKMPPEGGDIHTDDGAVGIFSVSFNKEHAPTRFIDMKSVLSAMSEEQRKGIIFSGSSTSYGVPTGESHRDMWQNMAIQQSDSEGSALAAMQALVDDYAIDVDIQPGTMVVFNNFRIMHQARAGSLDYIPFLDLTEDYVTRVLSTHFGSPSVRR